MAVDYIHPSVGSEIVDNSFFFATAQGLTKLLLVTTSERGKDNVFKEYSTPEELEFYLGKPNVFKYGQGLTNAKRWLMAGGSAYIMTVRPDSATYAHSMLTIGMKDTLDVSDVLVSVNLKPINQSFASMSTTDLLKTKLEATPVVVDNYTEYPLVEFRARGRGEFYNNLGYSLTLNSSFDSTFSFRLYDLKIFQKTATGDLATLETFTVSLDPEALNPATNESMHIKYVVEKYSQYFDVTTNDANYLTITTHLASSVTGSLPEQFDIISGVDTKGSTVNDIIVVDNTLMTGTLMFSKGSNGASDTTTINTLIANGYLGLVDASLFDSLAMEPDVILDANYPMIVKNAIAQLVTTIRKDIWAAMDCNFTANAQQAYDFRATSFTVNDFRLSIFAQHALVDDTDSGKEIKVTMPYFLASKIPTNDADFGIHMNFAGVRRGTISGFKAGSLSWSPNELWKENLYLAQVNYIETEPKRFYFGTALTSQMRSSALSNIPCARTILRVERELKKIAREYRNERNDFVITNMQRDMNDAMQKYLTNGAAESLSVTVYQSEYDKTQKVARVSAHIKFTGFVERIYITINVDK